MMKTTITTKNGNQSLGLCVRTTGQRAFNVGYDDVFLQLTPDHFSRVRAETS